MKSTHLAAALLMVTIWGFNFIVIRWGLNDVPPLTLTFLRFALAAFPAVLLIRRPQPSWRLTGYGLFAFTVAIWACFSPDARRHADRPRLPCHSGAGVLHRSVWRPAVARTH